MNRMFSGRFVRVCRELSTHHDRETLELPDPIAPFQHVVCDTRFVANDGQTCVLTQQILKHNG